MKSTIPAIALSLLVLIPSLASAATVEQLIQKEAWKTGAKAMFAEAHQLNPRVFGLAFEQARAGLLSEALDTLQGGAPLDQIYWLIKIAREIHTIPAKQREELVLQARDLARTGLAPKDKGYGLAQLAIHSASQGRETEARALFQEALTALQHEPNGIKNVVADMALHPQRGVEPWMLDQMGAELRRLTDPLDEAYSALYLAQANLATGRSENAANLIKQGREAAKRIRTGGLKDLALSNLSDAQAKLDNNGVAPVWPPVTQAIQDARAGHPDKAIARIKTLPENMYVSYIEDGFWEIVLDAIEREDLASLRYFAQHPALDSPADQIKVWRLLAEKQAELGQRTGSIDSYRQASAITRTRQDPRETFSSYVRSVLELGISMHGQSLREEGQEVVRRGSQLATLIGPRLVYDRWEAYTQVANAFYQVGLSQDGKAGLIAAYQLIEHSDTEKPESKAGALLKLAATTAGFGQSVQLPLKAAPKPRRACIAPEPHAGILERFSRFMWR